MRTTVGGIVLLVIAVVVLTRIGWPADDYRNAAFPSYWAAGRAVLEGSDPYATLASGVAAPPPWTAMVMAPLALLPFGIAATLWLAAQIVAIAAGLSALRKRVLLSAPTRDGPILAGLALVFLPIWLICARGEIDGFLFGALAGAIGAVVSGRFRLAGVLLGLLVFRPEPVLLFVPIFLFAVRNHRTILVTTTVVAGALVGIATALHPSWLASWWNSSTSASDKDVTTVWLIDHAAGLGTSGVLAVTLAIAGTLTFGIWWMRSRPQMDPLVAGALCLSVLLSPRGATSEYVLLLVTAAVIVELRAKVFSGRRLSGLIALAIIAGAIPWTLGGLALLSGGRSWLAVLPLLLLLLVVVSDLIARKGIRAWTSDGEGSQILG